ncbi:MAG: hypothetical protein JWM32_293 [Verrucomicrobia bacterium]|nr:hypothetical protein [Verrucomicrobiota bacterium]
MSTYHPDELRRLATQAHAQAKPAFVGGIAAGIVTGTLFAYAGMIIFASPYSLIIPGAVVGGIMGVLVGRRKAQALRLQAQMALCQIQIEKNTRRP